MVTQSVSLSNVPYLPADGRTIILSAFAGMLQVKTEQAAIPGDDIRARQAAGTRGQITDFSRRSRKRMIDALAKKRAYSRPFFMTLTYTDEVFFGSALAHDQVHNDLDNLQKRLARLQSDLGLIWRIEWEPRLSGSHVGEYAPHAHLIVDGFLGDVADFRRWLNQAWFELLQTHDPHTRRPRTDVQVAKSRRHACYYVSKYVAKVPKQNEPSPKTEDEQSISEKFHKPALTGRHWGHNGAWNVSVGQVLRLSPEQFVQLRRLIAGWSRHKNRRFARWLKRADAAAGFTAYGLGDEPTNQIFASPFRQVVDYLLAACPTPPEIV